MPEATTRGEFAYGSDCVDGTECPARAAGFETNSPVVGFYDSLINEGDNVGQGTVTEERARAAWLDAIKAVKQEYGEDHAEAQAARQIAEELDWL